MTLNRLIVIHNNDVYGDWEWGVGGEGTDWLYCHSLPAPPSPTNVTLLPSSNPNHGGRLPELKRVKLQSEDWKDRPPSPSPSFFNIASCIVLRKYWWNVRVPDGNFDDDDRYDEVHLHMLHIHAHKHPHTHQYQTYYILRFTDPHPHVELHRHVDMKWHTHILII